MPPRARTRSRTSTGPVPLSDNDVAMLRERLTNGKKPRVVLLVNTALGAVGTSVPVVGLAEPAEGEFISVRLADDVVPFSQAELGLPVRGRTTSSGAALALTPAQPPLAEPAAPATPYVPSGRPEPVAPPPQPAAESTEPKRQPKKRPARAGNLSLTLRFNGQTWSYESTRGGRRSASRPLNLAAVRAFADRIDDPALRKDVMAAVEHCREQAQTRADTLRAELERVEIELAELDD